MPSRQLDDAITAKVAATVEALGLASGRAVPYLLHLLGVEAASEPVAENSPAVLKSHAFAALRQLWHRLSQQGPVILAVEDLHWTDPTSEEFLASLADALPGAPLLILATYRPGYRPPWVEKSYTSQLTPGGAPDHTRFGELVPTVSAPAYLAACHAELAEGTGLGARASRDPLPRRGYSRVVPLMAAVLGEAYALAGRIDDARLLLTQAREQAIATEVVVNQANDHTPGGRVLSPFDGLRGSDHSWRPPASGMMLVYRLRPVAWASRFAAARVGTPGPGIMAPVWRLTIEAL
jgi:hypothetical protein